MSFSTSGLSSLLGLETRAILPTRASASGVTQIRLALCIVIPSVQLVQSSYYGTILWRSFLVALEDGFTVSLNLTSS